MNNTYTYVIRSMINNMGTIIIVAYFLSRVSIFKNLVTERKNKLTDKIIMSVIFGLIGVLATYTGVPVNRAIANSRIIGVLVGGIFGGPLVGIGAGIIAGIHRWAIDIGGFTAVACAVSTIIEGAMGGISSKYIKNLRYKWVHALIIGIFAELTQMGIILLIARPFSDALELVKIIWVPMVIFNPIGIALFVAIIDDIYNEQKKEAAQQTQLALDIAEKCLPYLRKGIDHVKSIEKVAQIILEMSGAAAVAITDKKKVIAHAGMGYERRKSDELVKNELDAIQSGEVKVVDTVEEVECDGVSCILKSAVMVPLIKKGEVVGSVVMYKIRQNSISNFDLKLAEGLARIFSTQLELVDMDKQIELRQKAELKALQSQINPHFLFNALNTIVAFCRTKPEKARELLIYLSTYFRNTLQQSDDFVDIETELKHVNAYLNIEKARFEDKLKVVIDVEKGISCKVPQLILQPLVENAVKHGIRPLKMDGIVYINVFLDKDNVVIVVEDNGVGIDEKLIDRLYQNDMPRSKVGLANVNSRLKNIYGDEFGLKVDKINGGGTRVEMRIPVNKEGEIL